MKKIDKKKIEDIFALTPMQEGMLFHYLKDPENNHYFEQLCLDISGEIDLRLFEQSWNVVIERNEMLRTLFRWEKIRAPSQIVLKQYRLKTTFINLLNKKGLPKEKALEEIKTRDRIEKFNLTEVPFRITLCKIEENQFVMIISNHHILYDGWSNGIILREFFEVYHDLYSSTGFSTPPAGTKFKEFVRWLREKDKSKAAEYWTDYLRGIETGTRFPMEMKKNRAEKSLESLQPVELYQTTFSKEITRQLEKFVKEFKVTIASLLYSAWGVLLQKYTGKDEVLFGTTVSGRCAEIKDIENIVGLFINTIPLRAAPYPGKKVIDFLYQINETLHQREMFEWTSLVEIKECSEVPKDEELFNTIIVIENYPLDKRFTIKNKNAPLSLQSYSIVGHTNYDLAIGIVMGDDRDIEVTFNWQTQLMDTKDVKRLRAHFTRVIECMAANPGKQVEQIDILGDEEKKQLLYHFNDTTVIYPGNKVIHELFEEQVERIPDHIAVVAQGAGGCAITYEELNQKANQLAYQLRREGVKASTIIGILLESSVERVVAMTAILKAGGAYLPIDPGLPLNRIVSMLEDCDAPILLTNTTGVGKNSFTLLKTLGLVRVVPRVTGHRPQLTHLDDLPIPDRSLVNYDKYMNRMGQAWVKHSLALLATRGCPYKCAYCQKVWPDKYVVRSAENIFAEVELYYHMGVRRFVIVDDIFNMDIKNSSRFFQLLIERGLDVHLFFPSGMRGDLLTREYIDLMVRAGVVSVALALETASPRLQKLIGKHINIEKFRENLEYLCDTYPHVITELFTMHGFPTETEEEAMMTLDFIKNINGIHFPYINILRIYSNTAMYRMAVENGISPQAIFNSQNLYFHEIPETLPFDKNFTRKYQADFLNQYFLSRERLLHVLPYQMKLLTKDEIIRKYNGYLEVEITCVDDLLQLAGISRDDLGVFNFLDETTVAVPHLNDKIKAHFSSPEAGESALKVLFLDLSQFFSSGTNRLDNIYDAPLGMMYVMSYMNRQFGTRVKGRIAKSRVNFDSFQELKVLLEEFKPDIIGLRALTYYRDHFHRTAALIRQWGFDVPIVTGGPYATSNFNTILQDRNIDLAVIGEGEATFTELIEKILKNEKQLPGEEVLKEIPGLAFIPGQPGRCAGKERIKTGANVYSREIIMLDEIREQLQRNPKTNLILASEPHDPTYVMFTSGSTGKPKGVIVEHKSVINNLHWFGKTFAIEPGTNLLQMSDYTFDPSVEDIFGSLVHGATLYLSDKDLILDRERFRRFIKENRIHIIDHVPAMLDELLGTGERLESLRVVISGGMRLEKSLKDRLIKKGYPLYNNYGPTETTVDVLFTKCCQGDVTLGTPIFNMRCYIFDRHNHLVPVGVAGELCASGDGISRGYLNNPELTAVKFVENPLLPFERIYRTGDMGRWVIDNNANLTIEFLGRIDEQVKIRGNRVELEEIQNWLQKYENIKENLVTAWGKEVDKYLCAYIVPHTPETLSIKDVKEYLSLHLPTYMVPTYFVTLAGLPLSSTGKIDRKALPHPKAASSKPYMAPASQIEARLVDAWAEVLGIEGVGIGIDDNFFELGGHSLKILGLIGGIHKKLNIEIPFTAVFEAPTVRELARYISKRKESRYDAIPPAEKKDYFRISSVQGRLYFLYRMAPQGIVYNITGLMSLEGDVDTGKLEAVFQKLIARHESLRTSFFMKDEQPVQRIHDDSDVNFRVSNYRLRPNEKLALEKIIENFVRPFDLARAPLMRVGLIKAGELKYILVVDMHHIISDGVSIDWLTKEFAALYREETLPVPLIQYKDFSEWQGSKAQQDKLNQQGAFWLREFQEEIPILDLPVDYPRPALQSFEGSEIPFHIDPGQTRALKRLALREGTTSFMVLLSIFTVLLSKICDQEDIIVGTPVAGRRHTDLEHIMGMFVNTLPLRNFPCGEKTFKEFLGEVKDRTLQAFSNQDYPYADLVEKVVTGRDASRSPLFDVLFVQQEAVTPAGGMEVRGSRGDSFTITPYPYENHTTKFDLVLETVEIEGVLHFKFEYCVKLFKKETITRFINYSRELISTLPGQPLAKLAEIEIITGEEKHHLLFELNDTAVEFSRDKSIHRLFEEQVQREPDHTVLVGQMANSPGGDYITITYNELNRKANQLAYLLKKEKGVFPDTVVAIMLDRCVDMIPGILGILKVGGAYVPVEPTYPAQRIISMMADCQTPVFLTTNKLMHDNLYTGLRNRNMKIVMLDQYREQLSGQPAENLTTEIKPGNLAYGIFTSGSTGKPKGVLVEHRSLNNLVSALQHRVYKDYGGNLNVCLISPFVFDASVKQIFPVLLLGHRLYIVPEDVRFDGSNLLEFYKRNMIDISDGTPGHIRLMLNSPCENMSNTANTPVVGIKLFLIGGEALPRELASGFYDRWGGGGSWLVNCYGPTECCDVTHLYMVERGEIPLHRYIPIGKLMANLKAYILGYHQRLQPVGIPGELYIAGAGLARGYLNRPELTAEKFDHDLWDLWDYQDKEASFGRILNTFGEGGAHELHELPRIGAISSEKLLRGEPDQLVSGSVGQWVSSMTGSRGNESLIMAPRQQSETDENQQQRIGQHIGSPRRGAPGRRGQKLYKTGDQARWLPDGNIEYFGRVDEQVKIRGFRVELGEIENTLLACDGIKEAAVLVKEDETGDNYICAYIVVNSESGNGKNRSGIDFREQLSRVLPAYMIPTSFINVDKIPLTPNGKVDRKALPGSEPGIFAGKFVGPRSEVEMKLVEIWSRVLGISSGRISIHDNFFNLGGHSLKATQLVGKIHKELKVSVPLAEVFKTSSLEGLASYIKKKAPAYKYTPVRAVERKEYYPPSSAQKRFYVLQQMDPANTGFNFSVIAALEGKLDKKRLETAFRELVKRHECLRTSFKEVEGTLVQQVHRQLECEFLYDDVIIDDGAGGDKAASIDHFIRPFDLSRAPLLRVGVIETEQDTHTLMVDLHHISVDGLCLEILLGDLLALYEGKTLPPLPIQYKDYSLWQLGKEQENRLAHQLSYWLKAFDFERNVPTLSLPIDYKRPVVQCFEGDFLHFRVGPRENAFFREIAQKEKTTLYIVLLTICNIWLSKVCNQDIIITGTGAACRRHPDIQGMAGSFQNMLALVNYPRGEKTFKQFLKEVTHATIGAFENQEYPFEELVKKVGVNREQGRNPLFDFFFLSQDEEGRGQLPGTLERNAGQLNIKASMYRNKSTRFDLGLYGHYTSHEIIFTLEYGTRLFKPDTIQRLVSYFLHLTEDIVSNPNAALSELDIFPEKEKKEILFGFNDTEADYARDKTMHRLFEEQAQKNPGNIAAIGDGELVTYSRLNEKANRLAWELRKRGLKPNSFAAVIMDRSVEMVVGVMAILKAGGAYAPLEPYLPDSRIITCLSLLKAEYLLTNGEQLNKIASLCDQLPLLAYIFCLDNFYPEVLAPGAETGGGMNKESSARQGQGIFKAAEAKELFKDKQVVLPGEIEKNIGKNPDPASVSGDIAYVIFTSGTTGTPKGVVVRHRPAINVIQWVNRRFEVKKPDKLLFVVSLGFDLSVYDIFGILASGAAVRIAGNDEIKSPERLLDIIFAEEITFWDSAPAALQLLVPYLQHLPAVRRDRSQLRLVFLSGDWIPLPMAGILEAACKGVRVIALGGATEATIWSNYFPIERVESHWVSIPYGKPIPNARYYILDEYLNPCPPGTAGDLYIGGECLASGYLGDDALTAEKFIDNPFVPGEKMYKTGDLARWFSGVNPDMEFLGRKDNQVKIRGYRIELGEVESRLLDHEHIKDAVVVAKGDAREDRYLCAYYVSDDYAADQALSADRLSRFLSKTLPDYMIPPYFVKLEKMPVTPNGKIDRKALPEPVFAGEPGEYTPPRDEIEKKLARIWSGILKIDKERISINTDFFQLGGHSLNAAVLVSMVHKELQVKLPLARVFQLPTIKGMANYIKEKETGTYGFTAIEPVEKKEYYPLSPTQKRLYVLHQLIPGSTGYNVTYTIPMETHVDKEELEAIFKRLIARHESLRTSFLMIGKEPVQRIHEQVEFKIEYDRSLVNGHWSLVNCQGRGEVPSPVTVEEDQKTENRRQKTEDRKQIKDNRRQEKGGKSATHPSSVIRRLSSEFIRPFDLAQAPLLRAGLIKLHHAPTVYQGESPGNKYILLVDMHHIITDAASLDILEKEFSIMKERPGKEPEPLRLQYRDFSEWVNDERQKTLKKQQESYWLKEFYHEPPVLNLPTDYPRPLMQNFEGNTVNFAFNLQETRIIKEIARDNGITLFMCLLTVFNILYSKLSGQEDIIIGTPIAARRHADLQHIIGMLVNTLPLRNYPSADKTFPGFLQEVKQRTLEAYENQEYPFEDLVDHLLINRDTSRNPLFDVMLNLVNQPDKPQKDEMTEVPTQPPYEHRQTTSRFDLVFSAMESGEHICFFIEYSTRLFLPGTVERFITYFKNIVYDLPGHAESRLADIQLLSVEERRKLLRISAGVEELDFNAQTIPGMFEEQVEKTPDRIALMGPGMEQMSYRKLNQESNRLAYFLAERGVGRDTVVGLMKERSIAMIIGILAILKAGGAYLPIDPQYPQQRIETMLNDSKATVLLTKSKELASFSIIGLKNMKARDENIVVTPARDPIKDFDRLPIPDRTLIDYKKYHQYIGEAPAKHTITLQATRGCPYHCLYCHKIWSKKHVTRSAGNIFKEISYAYEAGVRRFVFIDDIFNLDHKNAAEFLENIIKSGMDIQLFFPNGFRADILTRDFIDLMAAAGTVNLDVALESASPRIQKLIRKNLDLEKFKENVQYITRTYPQIILEMEMMHGFPTESQEEAMMTLDFLKSFKWVHFPNLHVLKIFPNTEICRLAIENGISQEAIERSASLAFHELPDTLPFSKSFTRQFQAKFMGEYFLSKERLRHVLSLQMKILTEDELVQKYDSYLSSEIKKFDDILRFAGISREELANGDVPLMQEEQYQAPDFVEKISRYFPVKAGTPADNASRILLLDLSQLFSEKAEYMLHHQIEEPLGLLYLMTYLNETFKDRIHGKICKSRIDFDSYDELKTIIFDFKPDLIGLRTLSFYKEFFHETVLMIRQWGVEVPIVAGGPYATSDYHLILQDRHVDVVVLGEGELTLAQLVEKIMENNNQLPGEEVLQDLRGIAFRSGENQRNPGEKTRDILLPDEIPGRLNRYPAANPVPINQADDLLYVIYTSGSTGTPKGVMLEHGNLVNLIRHQYNHTDIDFSRVLQFTSIGFDVSAQEIFSTLLAGGLLSLVTKEMLYDVPGLFKKVKNDRIKTLFLPTSFLRMVMNEENFLRLIPDDVDHIVTAGEQAIVNRSFGRYLKERHIYFHNHYGPSETHVVTALSVAPGEDIKERPPIGRPVLNTSIYILDKGYHLVPVGIPGELFIGGFQVGRGYLNNPELTSDSFFYRSYRSYRTYISKKFYQTGDLGRWLPDGNIEFLGRSDQQVKIRGFRVELGEIESQILKLDNIKEAIIITSTDNHKDKYLCAYIVAKSNQTDPVDENGLKEYLSNHLPDYMIPSYFVRLDRLPLTPNGKIDRKSLPVPGITACDYHGNHYQGPRDEIEKKLTGIWSEVLGIEAGKIGIDDNFFHLGGHSLKAMVVMNRIQEIFSTPLTIRDLFQLPTIAGLAPLIQKSTVTPGTEIRELAEQPYYELSYSQKRLWLLSKMESRNKAYNLPVKITLYEAVDQSVIEKIIQRWIARHESFRTFFKEIDEKEIDEKELNEREINISEVNDREVGEEPVQVIKPVTPGEAILEVSDWSHLEEGERESRRQRLLAEEASHVFNLEQWPLFRVRLIKYGTKEYDFVLNMHHIITDGWSLEILRQEFTRMYEASKKGNLDETGVDMEPLRIQYKDYAAWHNRLLEDEEKMGKANAFWKRYLSGTLPGLDLPYDSSPGPEGPHSRNSSAYIFAIDRKTTEGLRSIAGEYQGSLFMVLLAGFNLLLSHITGQEEILMAVPAAARQHVELKNIIGMFVNTLVLRSRIDMNETFIDLFRVIQDNTFDALEYQGIPMELIFSELKMKYPGISIFFNMVNIGVNQEQRSTLTDLRSEHIREVQEAKFEMVLYLTEYENAIQVSCHYFRELFRPGTIERIMGLFTRILENISTDPGKKAKDYCISPKKKNIFGGIKGLKNISAAEEEKTGQEESHIPSQRDISLKPFSHDEAALYKRISTSLEINAEVKEAQKKLSKVNIDFLDYVEKNPGCFNPSNFQLLDLQDDLFRLQPWPTFINPGIKAGFRQVGVRLFNLLKQIPARVFGNNLQKMSDFYEIPVEVLELQLEGVTGNHIDNLVGRGDFILSSTGIKCLEYNVSSHLGGLEIPAWESLYLQTPILDKFFKEYRVKARNENLLGLFLEHALGCGLEKLAPQERELNIALVINGYEEKAGESKAKLINGDYLNRLYREKLRQAEQSLKGEVVLCDYQHLEMRDNCIFFKGKKIHVVKEGYNGLVSPEVMTAFKSGSICMFNGPITKLLSNKLNLAVLSDPATNSVFTEEDRQMIAARVPWTRKTIPAPTTYKSETIRDLEQFMLTRRERLVIKPALGYGGDGVRVGAETTRDQWEEYVKTALHERNWVVQELVEGSGGVYQVGDGCGYHDMVWGFFIFGARYTGSWLRVMPREQGKRVINCHEGAAVSIIFEVDE